MDLADPGKAGQAGPGGREPRQRGEEAAAMVGSVTPDEDTDMRAEATARQMGQEAMGYGT